MATSASGASTPHAETGGAISWGNFPSRVGLPGCLAYECLDFGKHIRLSDVHHAQFNIVVMGPQHLACARFKTAKLCRRVEPRRCMFAGIRSSHSIPRQLDSNRLRRHVHARWPAIGYGRDMKRLGTRG
jgi:hypothetical protein